MISWQRKWFINQYSVVLMNTLADMEKELKKSTAQNQQRQGKMVIK